MLRWQTAGESHGEALVGPSPADGWGMAVARA